MKKYTWWGIGGIAVVGLLVTVVATRPMPTLGETMQKETTQKEVAQEEVVQKQTPSVATETKSDAPAPAQTPAPAPAPALADGRYSDYSANLVDDTGYTTTILFFYAGWCPECRGYDMAIKDSVVPDGVQILKLNYDDVQDLRQKYGVTIQSTFVRVNSAGDKQVLWNGYGREKSIDVILENTK